MPAMERDRKAKAALEMSRGQHTFKQGDVTKALKGAAKAGLKITRLEIEGKKIIVFTDDTSSDSSLDKNEWDEIR